MSPEVAPSPLETSLFNKETLRGAPCVLAHSQHPQPLPYEPRTSLQIYRASPHRCRPSASSFAEAIPHVQQTAAFPERGSSLYPTITTQVRSTLCQFPLTPASGTSYSFLEVSIPSVLSLLLISKIKFYSHKHWALLPALPQGIAVSVKEL